MLHADTSNDADISMMMVTLRMIVSRVISQSIDATAFMNGCLPLETDAGGQAEITS